VNRQKTAGPSEEINGAWAERLGDPDLQAMLGVLAAASQIISQTEAVLRRAGADVRGNEWDLLVALSGFGPMRPSELLRRSPMSTNAPTVHAIIARLESRGLVEKRPHPRNSRGVLVSLSREGADLVGRMSPVLERKIINAFAAHFSKDELDTSAALMGRV
jgi:DNA-binding MarR family transcriptional regulator